MKTKNLVEEDLILLHPTGETAQDILRQTAGSLHAHGFVKDSFAPALLEREEHFPTGLRCGEIDVAIPHTDSEHVLETAAAVAVLDHPVRFHEMGNADSEVDVRLVINMAIKDPNQHLGFLSSIMGMIQDQDLMRRILASDSKAQIAVAINESLA